MSAQRAGRTNSRGGARAARHSFGTSRARLEKVSAQRAGRTKGGGENRPALRCARFNNDEAGK